MKIGTLAGTNSSGEPQRSTAYYYADLEKIKQKRQENDHTECLVHNNSQKKKEITLDNSIGSQELEISCNYDHKNSENHQNRDIFRNPFDDRDDIDAKNAITCKEPNYSHKNDRQAQNRDIFRNPFKDLDDFNVGSKNNDKSRHRVLSFDRDYQTCETRDKIIQNRYKDKDYNLSLKDLAKNRPEQEFNRERLHLNIDYDLEIPYNRYRTDRDNTENGQNVLSEYVEAIEVVNDGATREVPPLRDRQFSLPEYSTPERKEETYSTAGTFPMPEPKEKEPLLAELEIVGRLPLTQLETTGVRRSRSWYLCCPNVGDDEVSRDSSWRYASLRPVTAPPAPGQNPSSIMVATQSHSSNPGEDLATLRAERDALARALASERSRAAAAARAHDARLAELHGVIAELVRRRADGNRTAIPEEDVEDECESTTQPAGELDAEDGTSPESGSLPSGDRAGDGGDIKGDVSDAPCLEVVSPSERLSSHCESCLRLSEKDSQLCLSAARCCQESRGSSCEREHGSADNRVYTATGRCESRQAKVASRVRLKKTAEGEGEGEGGQGKPPHGEDWGCEAVCAGAEAEVERLALQMCAHPHPHPHAQPLLAPNHIGAEVCTREAVWRWRCGRLSAEAALLRAATHRATDTAHKLSVWCALQESSCVAVCTALRAADRALETYDVLLALAETSHSEGEERSAAESVACRLLSELESETALIGEPLLPPGPWLHQLNTGPPSLQWSPSLEARLRAHAARLKADTVTLRAAQPPPQFFTYHDSAEDSEPTSGADKPTSGERFALHDMEAALMLQEALLEREMAAEKRAHGQAAGDVIARDTHAQSGKNESCCVKTKCSIAREMRAAETDL